MKPLELAQAPGSYRWYYADVSSTDGWSAVVIFMIGSLFSSRYARTHSQGALPTAHAAVNFALYRHGKRLAWVLSEYRDATIDGDALQIGPSRLERNAAGVLTARIVDRTPWWPTPVHAELTVEPTGPQTPDVTLVEGLSHTWHPYAVRSRGAVRVRSHDVEFSGAGYHDGNSGSRVLGSDSLAGWSWTRTHRSDSSSVVYRPRGVAPWEVRVDDAGSHVTRMDAGVESTVRTAWGLEVPRSLGVDGAPVMLESSPFYARMEAQQGDVHSLGESADFARFHSPLIRWMAAFRTRTGKVAP